jgi:hypothetical protein
MPLNQDDRIAFSKKIVEAPFLIAAINKSKETILTEKEKAQKLDDGHKNLVDSKTVLVNAYQGELIKLDGITRSTLTEQDQQDAANFVLGNNLYPNNPQNPPPSTAPSVWTKTKPYARNLAVGKFYNEAYGATVTKESDVIALATADVTTIQSTYALIEQVTGQTCTTPGGTCSIPMYVTQPTCVMNGGVWTPGVDTIATYPAVQTALTNLISKVNDIRAFLVSEAATIYTSDSDNTRKTESLAALNNINNVTIPAIDAWLALPNFNTAHGQTTCSGFFGYNPTLLAPTKLSTANINALLTALSNRGTFATTRSGQLSGYLGSITQNLSSGDVTGSGLYFERFSFIQLRLNLLGGSLITLKGYERANNAQDDQISNINAAKATYELILRCSAFSAPATGTKFLSVKSTTGLSAGDNVYVIADGQPELTRTIESVSGNRIVFGQPIPANYKDSSFGRVYKDLT